MQNYFPYNNYMDRVNKLVQMQNQLNQNYPNYAGQQSNNQIIFVQGETGAKAYQIPINSTVLLMSSEANEFFIKSTDQAGFPTIKKYKFTEVIQATGQSAQQQQVKTQNFVTREEFEALKNEIKQLKEPKNEPDNENVKPKKPDNKRA